MVNAGQVRVPDHAYEEMLEDEIDIELILAGMHAATEVEDYPDTFKGPSVLVLLDHGGRPVHVVWGLSKFTPKIATLITVYFPDPAKWYDGFRERKPE